MSPVFFASEVFTKAAKPGSNRNRGRTEVSDRSFCGDRVLIQGGLSRARCKYVPVSSCSASLPHTSLDRPPRTKTLRGNVERIASFGWGRSWRPAGMPTRQRHNLRTWVPRLRPTTTFKVLGCPACVRVRMRQGCLIRAHTDVFTASPGDRPGNPGPSRPTLSEAFKTSVRPRFPFKTSVRPRFPRRRPQAGRAIQGRRGEDNLSVP